MTHWPYAYGRYYINPLIAMGFTRYAVRSALSAHFALWRKKSRPSYPISASKTLTEGRGYEKWWRNNSRLKNGSCEPPLIRLRGLSDPPTLFGHCVGMLVFERVF